VLRVQRVIFLGGFVCLLVYIFLMDIALIVTLCVIGGLLLIAFAVFGVQKTIGGIASGIQFVVNEIVWGIPKTLVGSREREREEKRRAAG